jgi:hypothetical protein
MNDKSIYVIESGGLCKIGIARDPERRMMHLRVGSALPIMMINHWPVEFPKDVETRLHNAYAAHRTHGEWFRLLPVEIAWLHSVSDLTHYLEQWVDPWQFPAESRDADLQAAYDAEERYRKSRTFHVAKLDFPPEFLARMTRLVTEDEVRKAGHPRAFVVPRVHNTRLDRPETAGRKDCHE